jgi:hypothetical protein
MISRSDKRKQMSPQHTTGETAREEEREADRENDSVANKLSKELSNWRRRRTNGHSRREEGSSVSYKSESARTIKVRGHETLVVRKPKLARTPDSTGGDK